MSSHLAPLLEARSVAVVGASPRRGSVGNQLVRQLVAGGFDGVVRPVNPRYETVEGIDCMATIGDAGSVDLAVIAVANERLEEQVGAAIDAGARSIALFASCHGTASDGSPLAARLGAMASEAGVPVCGGNGMGFLNIERSLRVCGFFQPWGLVAGGVTFLTHSGSLFSAMLHNHRRIDFNLVVSTGNELATTMDEYLEYAVSLASTRVVGLFLETVRRPTAMAAALAAADDAGVPVVALKVGRTERSRASVATHSAAVAGEYAGFEAFAAAHGVHLVDTMDELADTLQLFAAGRPAAPGGLGAVHDSGGERSLLIDTAARVGVRLGTVGAETRARIAEVLDPGLEPDNPVDAWGTGHDAIEICRRSLLALADDPDVGAVVFSVDLTAEEYPEEVWGGLAIDVAAATSKPVAVLANLAGGVDASEAHTLAESGVPVLRGTETGLRAIGHLFAQRDRRRRGPVPLRHPDADRWARNAADDPFGLLAAYGIAVPRSEVVDSVEAAVAASERIGFPVVLKTAEDIAHKSDAGGVIVGVDGVDAVADGYRALCGLGIRVLVQQMAPAGVEISVGLTHDELFGPVVVVAAGGVLVEVMADRAVALAPVDPATARAMVDRLRVRPLLAGVRGRPAVDIESLVATIVAVGRIGQDLADVIGSLDVNPVIVHPAGCVAVDALVVTHA